MPVSINNNRSNAAAAADDDDDIHCHSSQQQKMNQQQQEKVQHQYHLYEFTPTIDVLSDGSECTSVTLFLSIWRRRRRRNTPDNAIINSISNKDNNNNKDNKRDLGVLVRRYALTGLTNGLGRLAADQAYSLSTIQAVVCPTTTCTNDNNGSSSSTPSFTSLEGLASLLLALHQGGTLHQFTVVLVPFNNVTTTDDNNDNDDDTRRNKHACPVEQIAKLMLDTKNTISSCPIRTCHVPMLSTPPNTMPPSSDDHKKETKTSENRQPWWMVYEDELLSIHTRIVPLWGNEKLQHSDVAIIFWYTLWCCHGTTAKPSTSCRPYNLGVAILPREVSPEQIQRWFRHVPERDNRLTAELSSTLDALILVGPGLEKFMVSSSSAATSSTSSSSRFEWVPLVLLASTTTATANSNTIGTGQANVLFRRAFQQATWWKSKFHRHIFVTPSPSQTNKNNQNHERIPARKVSPWSLISLVSGTSIVLSNNNDDDGGGCQVVQGTRHSDAAVSPDNQQMVDVDGIHRPDGNGSSSTGGLDEIEQLQQLKALQQELQDYETSTSTTRSSSFCTGDSPFTDHRYQDVRKDDNEIDLADDDNEEEQEKEEAWSLDDLGYDDTDTVKCSSTPASNPTSHSRKDNESILFPLVPHLLVLGTGCASPSSLRGSSGYGIFLPHVRQDATLSPSSTRCHFNNFYAPVGQHLILTAVLECGEDIVSQLYRFLPPPPPSTTSEVSNQPDHDAWFDYQLRQIRFIWISHAHLDHYGGLPTLLRRMHEAHQRDDEAGEQSQEELQTQRPSAKRFKSDIGNSVSPPSKCRRPLVIAPPRVLAYLRALSVPSETYQGVTQSEYDRNSTWQRWVTEITLTVTVPATVGRGRNVCDIKPIPVIGYREYRPFSILRHVPVDHGCANAYGLFLGLAPCMWYAQQEKNESVGKSHAHHPRFGDPDCRVLCFSGDTRPCRRFIVRTPTKPSSNRFSLIPNVDWLIHEATFDDKDHQMAHRKGHSTSAQALDMAHQLNAKLCLLTHFSQRYPQSIPYAFPTTATDAVEQRHNQCRPRVLFAFDGLFLPLLLSD